MNSSEVCPSVCRLLRAAIQGHLIRMQDFILVVTQLASQPESHEMLWTFVQENWKQITAKYHSFNTIRLLLTASFFALELLSAVFFL